MLNVAGSDAISAIGYDPGSETLRIEFNHENDKSKKYRFCAVPQHVFDGLLYSTSKGEYYDKHIRGKFLCI